MAIKVCSCVWMSEAKPQWRTKRGRRAFEKQLRILEKLLGGSFRAEAPQSEVVISYDILHEMSHMKG